MYVINPGFFTTMYLFFTCFVKETKKSILRYGDSYLFTWQKMVFLRTMTQLKSRHFSSCKSSRSVAEAMTSPELNSLTVPALVLELVRRRYDENFEDQTRNF